MSTPPTVPDSRPEPRAAVLGRFLRGSLGSGVAVGGRTAGALVLNKLLAVYGGPGGLTLLAHFQNLMALFTTLPNDGVHVGVVKYLAPLRAGSGRYRAWVGAGILLNLGSLLLAGLALVLAPGPLVALFEQGAAWTMLLLLGLGLLTGHAFVVSVLLAAGRLRAYVGLTVLLSLLGPVGVGAALALGSSVSTALLVYLLAQGATLGPALLVAYRAGLLPKLSGPVSRTSLRGLGRFLLMALSVLLFSKAVDFSLREVLVWHFGLGPTDLWQAVAKLSDNYTMVFSAVMSSVYYPRLAALSGRPAERRQLVRSVLLLLAPVLALGLGLLWLLRDWLLPLLFEQRFAQATFLLAPQLAADWLKFLTWVLLFLLTAQARVGRYVAVQAASAAVLAALMALLLPRYGLLGAPLAQAARYALLLMWCLWFFRREIR